MKSEELIKFAQQLKNARVQESISLEQISAKSRIDMKFLLAIEEGNFEILPEVYIKAFIKQYAVQTGLDPEETIADYEAAKRGRLKNTRETTVEEKDEPLPPPPTSVPPVEKTYKAPQEKKQYNKEYDSDERTDTHTVTESKSSSFNAKIFLTIVAAVVVIAGVYFFLISGSGNEIVKETPFDEIMQEKEEPKHEDKGDRFEMSDESSSGDASTGETIQGTQSYTASSDSLSLRLTANDTCWISADIDNGKSTNEFLLYPKQSMTVKALKNFELILGNAGGVQLYLNGKKLDVNVTSSGRKVLRINESGIVNNAN